MPSELIDILLSKAPLLLIRGVEIVICSSIWKSD